MPSRRAKQETTAGWGSGAGLLTPVPLPPTAASHQEEMRAWQGRQLLPPAPGLPLSSSTRGPAGLFPSLDTGDTKTHFLEAKPKQPRASGWPLLSTGKHRCRLPSAAKYTDKN